MLNLDSLEKWCSLLDRKASVFLNKNELEVYREILPDERKSQLKAILEKPIAQFTPVNDVYFRSKWAEALNTVHQGQDLKLLEVASGAADMIPQVMAREYPNSYYITANMNKKLNEGLMKKTDDLTLKVEIIEDDAALIDKHIGRGTVDIIAFQHSVNDVLQAILCEKEGIDTINTDWMETLPLMIKILQKEMKEGTLEKNTKKPFINLMRSLLKVLKTDGFIVINHYMFQLDLDWGYPAELFENIVPMTRKWLKELSECKELYYDEFPSQWWIFLKKM